MWLRPGLTASASGFTPFSIMEMQMERVRRSRWQFYSLCLLSVAQFHVISVCC